MDYGIIFIIILILIIVAVIIALVYVNRNNTLNILASLPNYRVLHVKSNTYLSLKNTNFLHSPGTDPNGIPITFIGEPPNPNNQNGGLQPFWQVYASVGFDNTSPFGLWKFEPLNGGTIGNGTTTVKMINTVYNLETPSPKQGFLSINPGQSGVPRPFFDPAHVDTGADTEFTLTTIATNTFTLRFVVRDNAAVVVDPLTNLLSINRTTGATPDVFQLQLV